MSSFIRIILLLTVFLTPLIGVSGNFGYEQAKVLFFIVFISLIGFLWLIAKPKSSWGNINKAGSIFILSLLVTSLTGIDWQTSLLGKQPYFQSWVLYVYLFLFSFLVSWAKIKLQYWALLLVGSASLVSLLAIKDWVLINLLGQQIPTYAGRVVSTFGQPNFFSGFLLLTLPFSYLLLQKANKKLQLLGWGSGIISFAGIMVSYSRSAIFLSLILLILALIAQLKIKIIIKIISVMVLLMLIGATFLSVKFSSGFVWKEIFQPATTSNPDLTKESVENRLYIWPIVWKVILQKSITGYGLENINQALSNYFTYNKHLLFEENLKISPVSLSLKELNIDRSHNYILDLLLYSGILGLGAWGLLVVVLIRHAIQKTDDRRKNVLIVSLITYLIWIQFQNQSVIHLIYFWLLVGLIEQNDILTSKD